MGTLIKINIKQQDNFQGKLCIRRVKQRRQDMEGDSWEIETSIARHVLFDTTAPLVQIDSYANIVRPGRVAQMNCRGFRTRYTVIGSEHSEVNGTVCIPPDRAILLRALNSPSLPIRSSRRANPLTIPRTSSPRSKRAWLNSAIASLIPTFVDIS